MLPQNDEDIGTRQRKLEKARNEYQLEQKYFSLTEDQQNQVNLVNVPPMGCEVWRTEKVDSDQQTPVVKPSTLGKAEDVRGWVKARMWFNMVDAQFHESITHLGFTHLLMDGVSVCMHRNLSDRHPIYKLLLPHFQYMHAINLNAHKLLGPGGLVDQVMYFGHAQLVKLLSNHNEKWTYLDMCLKTSLKRRNANVV